MTQNITGIKTTQGQALYEAGVANAAITASQSQTLFSRQQDKEAVGRHGSFNHLEVVNNTANTIAVDLDGLTSRRRVVFGKGSLVIKSDQNIYFNNIKIVDLSATNISQDTIFCNARILR